MITPLVAESVWASMLEGLPSWQPPMVPTLVVSPHPDDETLSVGGLIHFLTKSCIDVAVVAVTDGENAYEGQDGLGPVREMEQRFALAHLGVGPREVHRLRMKDSGLHDAEGELVESLKRLIVPGGHVVAPWTGDFHPDHEVCGRASSAAAKAVGATLSYYFFWTWHRGTPLTLDGLDLVAFPLALDSLHSKKEALLCHRSQLEHASGQPILPAYLLEPMERPYEVYLPA